MLQQVKQKWEQLSANKNFSFIAKGSLSTFITLGLVQGLRFISGIIIGRYYGADASGKLTLVITIMAIFTIIVTFGIKDAIQKLIPEKRTLYNTRTAFQYFILGIEIILVKWILICIVLYILAPYLANYWNEPNLTSLIRWSGIFILPTVLADYCFFALKAGFKVHTANITLIIPTVLRIILLIIVTLFWFNIYNPIYLHFATLSVLPFLFTIFPIYKHFILPYKDEKVLYKADKKEIYRLALPMFLTYFSFIINNNADVFLLKHFEVSTAEIGIYKTVTNIALLSSTLLVSLNTTIQPKLTQLFYKKEFQELTRLTIKSTKLIFWISLPIYLILFFFAKQLVGLYGSTFSSGTLPLKIMIVGQFFNTACGPVAQLLNATGHHKQFTYISILGALFSIIINILIVPYYGIIGAAIANTISVLFWNIIGVIYIKQKFGFIIAYH